MATFTGSFEVQRFQLEWSATGATLVDEDVRVCTFHAVKLVGGAPTPSWDPADFIALDNAFQAFWGSMKVWCPTSIALTGLKAYRAGPNVVPPQTPTYDVNMNVAGTSSTAALPPQVALSVTEKAGAKKNWGRFYFPALSAANASSIPSGTIDGRPSVPITTALADAADTLYEAARIANTPMVIYHPKLEANRPTGNPPIPSTLPERPAEAVTVEQLQVDDVWDIIRRRRWETVTLRTQRAVG